MSQRYFREKAASAQQTSANQQMSSESREMRLEYISLQRDKSEGIPQKPVIRQLRDF